MQFRVGGGGGSSGGGGAGVDFCDSVSYNFPTFLNASHAGYR